MGKKRRNAQKNPATKTSKSIDKELELLLKAFKAEQNQVSGTAWLYAVTTIGSLYALYLLIADPYTETPKDGSVSLSAKVELLILSTLMPILKYFYASQANIAERLKNKYPALANIPTQKLARLPYNKTDPSKIIFSTIRQS